MTERWSDAPEPLPPSGHRVPSWPWCVWCDQPMNKADHSVCRQEMPGSFWIPCLACLGGGVDHEQGTCQACGGFGFTPADGPMHEWIDLDDGEDADVY